MSQVNVAAIRALEAKAMRALDATGVVLRDEISKRIGVVAPRRPVRPFVRKDGLTIRFEATTDAASGAAPRVVNRNLQNRLKVFRQGPRTVRVLADVAYAAALEKKGKNMRTAHPFMQITLDVSKPMMFAEFCRVMRGP